MTEAVGERKMDDYIVGKIPGHMTVNPESGRQGQQRKPKKRAQNAYAETEVTSETGDSVDISAEARSRSAWEKEHAEPEDAEPENVQLESAEPEEPAAP